MVTIPAYRRRVHLLSYEVETFPAILARQPYFRSPRTVPSCLRSYAERRTTLISTGRLL
jgi:hypothetical protein